MTRPKSPDTSSQRSGYLEKSNCENDLTFTIDCTGEHKEVQDPIDAVRYVIEFREASMLTWQLAVSDCRKTSHIIDDLQPVGVFFFRIRAVNAYGISDASEPSEPVTAKILPTDSIKTLLIGKYSTVHEHSYIETGKSYAIKAIAKKVK